MALLTALAAVTRAHAQEIEAAQTGEQDEPLEVREGGGTEAPAEPLTEAPEEPLPEAPAEAAPGSEPEAPSAPDPEEEARGLMLGGIRWTPHLEVRPRGEIRIDPYAATGTGADEYFVTSRVRLGLGAEYDIVSALVQVQDARVLGQAAPGFDSATELHQGYLQLGAGGSYVRVGRQEIAYGSERMLGPLDWTSQARSFDALRLHWNVGAIELDAFGAITGAPRDFLVTEQVGDPPVTQTRQVHTAGDYLSGVRAVWTVSDALAIDLYALYRHDGPSEASPDRERDIVSPGLRLTGEPAPGLAYDVEGVFQTGRDDGEDHLAFGVAAELGYTFDHAYRPGVALGGSYATGDSASGDVDELDNFFPTNHKFYGYADLFGFRNLVHGYLRGSLRPRDLPLTLALFVHTFALAEAQGRWSNAPGATLGQSSAPGSSSLGQEIDVTVAYTILRGVSASAGYSIFIPNDGAARLGHPDPTHWAFLMLDVRVEP